MKAIAMGPAAGWLKRPADIDEILRVPSDIVSAVVIGSYTLEPRDGNSGNNFVEPLNSLGLQNPGIRRVHSSIREMTGRIRQSSKRSVVSVAEFSPAGYREAARIVAALAPDEIELNLSCPNVWKGDGQKPIASFAPDLVLEILQAVGSVTDHLGAPAISAKFSPYSDPLLLKRVAEVVAHNSHLLSRVVTCNTFPNAYGFDEAGKPLITQGYGGLSGESIKYIALGQAMQWRSLLPSTTGLTIVGGIHSGRDLQDARRTDADHVQVGTAFFTRGARVFQDIMMNSVI